MLRVVAIASILAGCHGDEVPAEPPPTIPAIAIAIDAPPPPPVAIGAPPPPPVAIDAASVPPPPPCASEHRFRFGTLTAKPGWCWYRTAEGDDQSGELHDPDDNRRARYTELSFDEKVGDPCATAPEHRAGGVAYRSCAVDTFRHCITFHGLANICSVPPEEPDLSLDALAATAHAK